MWSTPNDIYSRKSVRVMPIPSPHRYQPVPDDSTPTHSYQYYISKDKRNFTDEPLPAHMKLDSWPDVPFPLNKVCTVILQTCCLLSYGHRDLQEAWNACTEGGERWVAFEDRYANRMSQLSVIGGLIFTGLAAWVTTSPPMAHLLNYNERGPYICLITAFGGTWGGIIVASAIMYGTTMAGTVWYRETLMRSRSRVICTLILLSYPFFAMGVSTTIGVFGLLIATWRSPDILMNITGSLLLVVPLTMLFVAIWTQTFLLRSSAPTRCGAESA